MDKPPATTIQPTINEAAPSGHLRPLAFRAGLQASPQTQPEPAGTFALPATTASTGRSNPTWLRADSDTFSVYGPTNAALKT